MVLVGEANDYVGKSMSGGVIVLKPRPDHRFNAGDAMIAGNTCLYGSTGGRFFANGRVGERFAVRNSGATAVVEGLGDHGCEYMTNGTVVVLGLTGRNFGAGMTGGVAYVLDEKGNFESHLNSQLVRLERLAGEADASPLKELIYQHLENTESERARQILADWARYEGMFWKVVPLPPPALKSPVSPRLSQASAPAVVPPAESEIMSAAKP